MSYPGGPRPLSDFRQTPDNIDCRLNLIINSMHILKCEIIDSGASELLYMSLSDWYRRFS